MPWGKLINDQDLFGSWVAMLTLFSIPKPFRGNTAVIQRNAIQSWTLLHPACEVILLGDDEGTAETAARMGMHHVPQVEHNQYGTPLVHSLFAKAQAVAANSLLCYINSDIILTSDFLPAVQSVKKKRRFLLVGQRWDVALDKPWDFDRPDWEVLLRSYVRENGELHPAASDYFVFPKGLWGHIPPFAVGRTSYDNWFIYRARLLKVPIVDATRMVFCVHQNHERTYTSVSLKAPNGIEDLRKGIEAKRNRELAGGYRHMFTLKDATHVLTPSGQKLDLSLRRFSRHLDTLPILFPHLCFAVMLVMVLIRSSRPLRLALRPTANSTRYEKQ